MVALILRTVAPLFIILIWSCHTKPKPMSEYEVRQAKLDAIDSINKHYVALITDNNKAIDEDAIGKVYSYKLQKLLANTQRPFSVTGYLHDIIMQDGLYYMKVSGRLKGGKYRFMADIQIDSLHVTELEKRLAYKIEKHEIAVVFKVVKHDFLSPKLTSETDEDFDEGDIPSSYLTYSFDETLIFLQGEMFDFYLFDEYEED